MCSPAAPGGCSRGSCSGRPTCSPPSCGPGAASPRPPEAPDELRRGERWSWLLSLTVSGAGMSSAVVALTHRGAAGTDAQLLSLGASLGVVLSWSLLQLAFAEIYYSLGRRLPGALLFPGDDAPAEIDYLYLAVTLGTSFATSDVEIGRREARRVVLVHSVVAFFYNALVVAVAFQVLQQLVGS